jgi:hypothetical protein
MVFQQQRLWTGGEEPENRRRCRERDSSEEWRLDDQTVDCGRRGLVRARRALAHRE